MIPDSTTVIMQGNGYASGTFVLFIFCIRLVELVELGEIT